MLIIKYFLYNYYIGTRTIFTSYEILINYNVNYYNFQIIVYIRSKPLIMDCYPPKVSEV